MKNLIDTRQHGFMKDRSTTSNLITITEFISESINNNSQVDVIYTDFSKAFDRLDHVILTTNLSGQFGFSLRLTNFISFDLSDRLQHVECLGHSSSEIIAPSGVPQGFILGPLLFNSFINQISKDLDVHSLLYCDDKKIYYRIDTINDCIRLQSALNLVNDWCKKTTCL